MTVETFIVVDAGNGLWHIRFRQGTDIFGTISRNSRGFALCGSDGTDLGQFYNLPDTVAFAEVAHASSELRETA
jgi:hypothetical protein